MRPTRMLAGATTLAAAATFVLAAPAAAQPGQDPRQEGLVNVNVTDLTVQVPIALAATICDVNVAVLVSDLQDDAAVCTSNADSETTFVVSRDGGGGTTQQGLVNVNLEDVNVQIPITVAAVICDVNVAVLVDDLEDDAARCASDAEGDALVTPLP